MDYKKIYEQWLSNDFFDQKTKEELESIKDNEEEIKDRFYQELKFGTAGLRGKVGAGTNRMNIYTVSQATYGLAKTIEEYGQEAKDRGVVICYDVRHGSDEFSKVTAEVLAGYGIKVHIFKDIQPTPVCSYAIRKLNAISGVMVTASHNPREYNGYKAYWEEGSQILEETADKILNHIKEIDDFSQIKKVDFDKALDEGLINWIDESLIEDYINDILSKTINEEIDKNINIVYSPLNGCGNKLVRRILKERGFNNVHVVKEQENPDADFTTVGYPNPEDPKAFKLSLELAKKVDADICLATDPDSDRCALEVKDDNGKYHFLTGNKIGALMINYILSQLDKNNEIPENSYVVKSIVTGDLPKPICNKYNVKLKETLTGFKNICAIANEFDKTHEGVFLYGFEESIGYNYGDFVRDKDAVNSAMIISEMAAYYKLQSKSLLDVLNELYEEFGYYENDVISIVLEGADGQAKIARIMDYVRNNPLEKVAGLNTQKIVDYLKDDTGVQKSNVLKYYLDNGVWFALRPSGTEPKIKLYINAIADSEEKSKELLKAIENEMRQIIDSVE
ncbi:MAG: phospho-sugar mutase [Tissierellia bacterium]|nr:phospho-sugar mutase [Tissierellia bacterium]